MAACDFCVCTSGVVRAAPGASAAASGAASVHRYRPRMAPNRFIVSLLPFCRPSNPTCPPSSRGPLRCVAGVPPRRYAAQHDSAEQCALGLAPAGDSNRRRRVGDPADRQAGHARAGAHLRDAGAVRADGRRRLRAGHQRRHAARHRRPRASACPTATGATASRSAAWRRWIRTHGVISPGGIGFDINCGMRLVRTDLTFDEVRDRVPELVDALYERVPAGVGARGFVQAERRRLPRRCRRRARAGASTRGYGWPEDLRAHRGGRRDRRRRSGLRQRARPRARPPAGRHPGLGQPLPRDPGRAAGARLRAGTSPRPSASTGPRQVVVMFHCGSRGFGHQIATDYLQSFLPLMQKKFGIELPDRELACAPFALEGGAGLLRGDEVRHQHVLRQPPGDPAPHPRGLQPTCCSATRATSGCRWSTTSATTPRSWKSTRSTAGAASLLVHRKGATRAFAPGMPDVPAGVPRHRAAGDHRRQHGDRLLPAARRARRASRASSPRRTAAAAP